MTVIKGTRFEIGIGEDAYPEALRSIEKLPETLYVIGDPSVLRLPSIAITGTRRATEYGTACARRFSAAAAGRGMCVVTGGALGCEAAAMETALEAGGMCVAVLANGPDADVYPRANAELLQRVVEAGGAVVSEQPRDTPPIPWAFRARSRIVAGLASCLLICEAGLPSGAFAAADAALAAGKPVLAVPGRIDEPTSAGPNALAAAGATPVVSAAAFEDALMALGL